MLYYQYHVGLSELVFGMKIEQLIVQYLYLNKELTLPGIGTFKILSEIGLQSNDERNFILPEDAISFEYNIKAQEDTKLIDFIWEKTRKVRTLISSDLESFIGNGKQFLNIGNPFFITGLGTLVKTQKNDYVFFPGNFIQPKINLPGFLPTEKSDDEISFRSEVRGTNQKMKRILIIGVTVILVFFIAGWLIFFKKNKATEKSNSTIENGNITNQKLVPDSIAIRSNDSAAIINKSGYTFKVVIKSFTNPVEAKKSYKKLSSYGHQLILYTDDSLTYKLSMPFNNPLRDTALIKDSLKRFIFGGSPYIESH